MNTRPFVYIFFLMFMIGLTVQFFSVGASEIDVKKANSINIYEFGKDEGSWADGIPLIGGAIDVAGDMFHNIAVFLRMVFDALTFSIDNPVNMPEWLLWIPFIMVFPCVLTITIWIFPYFIEFLKAIASWIDSITPDSFI